MIPTIIIAGTHSGCGKTTIASAIMSALCRRGLVVQPFKVGPDFIDPSHHTAICSRSSRNLDPYMMGEDGVIKTFLSASKGADIAVVEGVMGMYDGLEGSGFGSTAHVSKIIKAPVILVVDVKGMSASANAIIKGYREYDPEVNFSGVIFNRVGSIRHREMIEENLCVPAVGWIPYEKTKSVESRHLGLQMAHETSAMSQFAEIVELHSDLDQIIDISKNRSDFEDLFSFDKECPEGKFRIAVALDEAFNFYYNDNLSLLKKYGFKVEYFSPISDRLPEGIDALYLGGGYPELHLESLEDSKCRQDIKKAADKGLVIYAECGGLTYLSREISSDGTSSRMCGIIPADTVKMERFQALGYVDAECISDSCIIPAGTSYRGHEFHYTRLECDQDIRFALKLKRGKGIENGMDGISETNIFAGYTHAYFTDEFVNGVVSLINNEKKQ
ncbi:cobyrinate a,c-diamide synthase [Methanoplanus sp. FWC-SCC4]|uniref:Cobyrinate a,c-diamide synthase n=1 Tax=Methanochimaera problematica TaxID=2609417 RepID=A0AA97I236_9EURY|nr:cobyrinate a,c-diamide synthase [Methanoplanus sp. FWC-SCC4]WOF15840.1 cobyrinate a,c-diamide synthase [Methanoplanus sp. FWC-SCC4]